MAAPTTSLPEAIGGVRNWDYRYCWLRDATFTLYALRRRRLHGGIGRAGATGSFARSRAIRPTLQIMYGPAGERRLVEMELPWLPGYEGSKPVRIGNAASTQLQLDVYGEVMDAMLLAPAAAPRPTGASWALQLELMKVLEQIWEEPDEGHLGGARAAAALHAFEGDGLGGVRPRDRHGGAPSRIDGCADRAVARHPRTHSRSSVSQRVRPHAPHLHAVLRRVARRRQPADVAAGRFPAGPRSADRSARCRRSNAT